MVDWASLQAGADFRPAEQQSRPGRTPSHPAQLPDARVGGLPEALSLHRRLAEEEEDLVVVGVFALGDPEGTDELGFWTQTQKWRTVETLAFAADASRSSLGTATDR